MTDMTEKMDIDAILGERWFPQETTFEEDLPLHWGDWGVSSEIEELKAVLMRRPGKEIDDFDWYAMRFRAAIDPDLFRKQHDSIAQVYKEHGVKVYYVEEQREDKPNALFCRDLMFMTPEGAIIGRPGMAGRRGEERYVAKALANLGVPIIRTVNGDGLFEGANAMWVDRSTVVLSTGSRCNRSGIEQVAFELARMGVTELLHMQQPYSNIHIDGLLNIADHDVAVIHASQVPYDICAALKKKGFKLLECPSQTEVRQTFAINFVALKPGLVVMPAGNPRTQALLEENGVNVIPVELEELMKGYGAMHCCTAFLKRG